MNPDAPFPAIDLALIDLDADYTPVEEAHRTLDAGELARAARLRQPQDARRFLLRRLYLRRHLADRLGCGPADIRFALGAAGKPFVVGGGVSFSTSHSCGQALVAVAERGEIGCDIERIDPAFHWRATLSADVLTADETDRLAGQEPAAATALFFALWTLKEACLKCGGYGLSVPARTVRTSDDGSVAEAGSMRATGLRLHPGFAAAVAWDTA